MRRKKEKRKGGERGNMDRMVSRVSGGAVEKGQCEEKEKVETGKNLFSFKWKVWGTGWKLRMVG